MSANNNMKTYKDSYLYNNKVSKAADKSDVKSTTNAIIEYIKTAHRIDTKDEAFRGIIEDIKFQNSGSLLYAIAIDPRVKICIGNTEMPRAFKVMDAYDVKNDKQPVIFIDASGIIEYKNGRYFCRKIDTLCAYLFDAMIYLIYRYAPSRLTANSTVLASATECYVSMFSYIIDYMRIIGYSVNKNKINYLVGMFFLVNMVGIYPKAAQNIAAKVADVNTKDLHAYSLYFENDLNMFSNIAVFIDNLTKLFNLKGFTLEVFVSKWIYLFGTGTHYATELFTSFLILMCNACSGSYIVNQRTVQKCCGKNNSSPMIKLYLAIKKAGIDTFDLKGFMNESLQAEVKDAKSKFTRELAENIKLRDSIDENNIIFTSKDFKSKDIATIKEECNTIKTNLKNLDINRKSNRYAEVSINNMIDYATENAINFVSNKDAQYTENMITTLAEGCKNMLDSDQLIMIKRKINNSIGKIDEAKTEFSDKLGINKANKIKIELRDMLLHL